MEFWFTPPPGTTSEPPRWKMAIVSLLVMYPLSLRLSIPLEPAMAIVPPILAPLIMMGVMIPLVTYMVMPLAKHVFSPWLFFANQPKPLRE